MCAINGFTGPRDEARLLKMNHETIHRGPDGTRTFFSEGINFGHNRLAILDPRAVADQPMTDVSGRYTIIYNGEVYNYKELRQQISYPYQTNSDTEVILAGFIKFGPAIFQKLNGMFACAIWDRTDQALTLARDIGGIKPLFYTFHEQRFIFSSEVRGLLVHDIPREFSRDAFLTYMSLLYTPTVDTLIRGVSQVVPGTTVRLVDGKQYVESFGEARASYPSPVSFSEGVTMVRETMHRAVTRHLISDKPLGIFLSGGIDSSAILVEATRTRDGLNTFSVAFSGLGDASAEERFNADARLAAQTAAQFGTQHHTFELSLSETGAALQGAITHLSVPISSATELAQYALAEKTKKIVDVALSGDGGDELFGGYERYQRSLFLDRLLVWETRDAVARRVARFMAVKSHLLNQLLRDSLSQQLVGSALSSTALIRSPQAPLTQEMLWFDKRSWLVNHALLRSDHMSMAHGLEVRVPFLDKELVELAESLPFRFKVTPHQTKRILRSAYTSELTTIVREPKRGWFSPATKWLRRGPVSEIAREAFSEDFYPETNQLVDWFRAQTALEEHRSGKRYAATELWALLTFQLWAKTFRMKLV